MVVEKVYDAQNDHTWCCIHIKFYPERVGRVFLQKVEKKFLLLHGAEARKNTQTTTRI